jgi:chemotaxis protein CheX
MNAALKLQRVSIDHSLLQDVVNSVTGVFADGFGIKVGLKSSRIGRNLDATGDVSGVVGMIQDRIEGNLIICFNSAEIFSILARVYGHTFTAVDDTVKQGAAEMANMVYGHVKTRLNQRGHDLKMSLPNVIVGSQHSIRSTEDCSTMLAVFEFEGMSFQVIVAVLDDYPGM